MALRKLQLSTHETLDCDIVNDPQSVRVANNGSTPDGHDPKNQAGLFM